MILNLNFNELENKRVIEIGRIKINYLTKAQEKY